MKSTPIFLNCLPNNKNNIKGLVIMVSVIIPVFNCEKYIEETLTSISRQTYEDLEIIIVDDGSTDNSMAIVKDYVEKDNRVKAIKQENKGVSAARNKGLEVAKGEYVTFVDADDIIASNMIYELVKSLGENDFSCCILTSEIGNLKGVDKQYSKNILDRKRALIELLSNRLISYSACGKLFRTENARKILFDINTGMLEDYLFVVSSLCVSEKVVLLNIPMYCYVKRKNSALNQPYRTKRLEFIYSYEKSIEKILIAEPDLVPYFNTKYLTEVIELMHALHNDDKHRGDYEIVQNKWNELKDRKMKGSIKNRIKICMFKLNHEMYYKIFDIKRKIIIPK